MEVYTIKKSIIVNEYQLVSSAPGKIFNRISEGFTDTVGYFHQRINELTVNLFYLKFGQRTLAVCPPIVLVDCDEGIPALEAVFKKEHIKTGLK